MNVPKVPKNPPPLPPGMDNPWYDYAPFPARPRLTWPRNARVAFFVLLHLEYWELNPDKDSYRDPRLVGEFGSWRHDLSLRHAEILCALAQSPQGRTAPELAEDLYGDRTRVVTVRAEMSRLRKQFAGLLAAQPYRFASSVGLTVCYPTDRRTLLPPSTAPAIRAARLGEDG